MAVPWQYRLLTLLIPALYLLPSRNVNAFSYQQYVENKLLPAEKYVVEGDIMIGVILPLITGDPGEPCGSLVQTLQFDIPFTYALKFAFEEINNSEDILPGTSLGFYMIDDCLEYGTSIIRVLQMVSDPIRGPMPGALSLNFTYPYPVLALIGPGNEERAAIAGHVAGLYNVPMIVPYGSDPRFKARSEYPTVWSPVPGGNVMPRIFLTLLEHFNWTYFTVLYSDREWGVEAHKTFNIEAQKRGMCVGDSIMLYEDMDFVPAARRVIESGAEVLLISAFPWHVQSLFDTFDKMGYNFKFHMLLTFQTQMWWIQKWAHHIHGTLRYQIREPINNKLMDYLDNKWPGDAPDNPWLPVFFNKSGWDPTCTAQSVEPCDNMSVVVDPKRRYFLTWGVAAAYSVAQAIHDAVARKCEDAFGDIDQIKACVTPIDVNDEIPLMTVHTGTRTISYKKSTGDADAAFDIYQSQGNDYVHVGYYDMVEDMLEIYNDDLDWGPYNWSTQPDTGVPWHRCSDPCPIGHFQIAGEVICCWQCFPCRKEEYLVNNATSCERCPDKWWPLDERKMECVPIPHTYLTWDNLYGVILASFGGAGLLLTLLLSTITTTKRDLRAIKGSGVTMLHVMLVGLYLAFASVFAHIAKPSNPLCVFGRAGFHLSFTLIFGPMLVKTNRVFQVFFASAKLSRKVFMGSELSQQTALAAVIGIQVGLIILSVILWPAVATDWMPVKSEEYVELYCDVPQMSLIIGTSFNLLLIAGCCILAFIARGLPDNFNECWYIFLCVVATIFIWIAFFTTYFSAFYAVYKAALLAAALIMNSLVVIIAFFGPKIYAIAFIADKDIKITDFEGSVSRGRQTETSVVSHGTSDTNVSEK